MNAASAYGQTDREPRGRMIARLFVVLLLAGFSVSLSLWSLEILWRPVAGTGLQVSWDEVDSVDPGSPADRAGVRAGDTFASDTPFFVRTLLANSDHFRSTVYSFNVIRNGQLKRVTIATTPIRGHLEFGRPYAVLYAVSVFVFLLSAIVGTFVVLVRPSRLTWMFFLFCIGPLVPIRGAMLVLFNLPMPLGFVLNLVRVTLVCVGQFGFLGFALCFPSGNVRGWRKTILLIATILLAPYVAWGLYGWFAAVYSPLWFWPFVFPNIDPIGFDLALFFVSVASIVGTYRSAVQEERQRLKWAAFGVSAGFGAVTFYIIFLVAGLLWSSTPSGWLAWNLAYLAAALAGPPTVAYAILKGRVIDPRFVINRALVYFTFTSILAVALGSTYWATSIFLQHARIAALIQLVVAIAVGVCLHRAYRQFDSVINRVLFKPRYEALEHLERLAGGLGRAESIQELEMLVTAEPVAALDLNCGALYRQSEDCSYVQRAQSQAESLPTQLAQGEPLIVRLRAHHRALRLSSNLLRKLGSGCQGQAPTLAVPLYVSDALYAVVMYGTHENGTDLDPTERVAIEALQVPAERAYAKLLRQADKLRELSVLLANSPSGVSDDVHSYLASQVIDLIPERTRAALVACAAVPGATVDDIARATGHPEGATLLFEFASRSPLVRQREDGTFAVHDLIARLANARFPDRCREMLVRCAQRASEQDDWHRAARLFGIAGLQSSSLQELEKSLAAADPALLVRTSEDCTNIAALDFELLKHRPHLWIQRGAMRLFRDAMRVAARESRLVCNPEGGGSPPRLLGPWCAYLHAEIGELASATARLEASRADEAPSFATEFRATVTSLVAGRLGHVFECKDKLDAVAGVLTEECRAANALVRASLVERMLGRWNQERAELDFAIDAFTSRDSRFTLWALSEGVVGAWLVGQERARLSYTERLKCACAQYDARSFVHFATVSTGKWCDPGGAESPRWLAYAYLFAACGAPNLHDARRFAALALGCAADAREPFLQLLTRIACAEFDEGTRDEHLHQVLELSKAIDAPPVTASVRAYIANDENVGMLGRFLVRLRQDRDAADATLTIELAAGRVRRGAQPVALSERELAVALALARSPKSMSSMELTDLIWPDLNEGAGAHAMQTCVHRLRQRLGDPRAVQNTTHGYRLRDDVVVDLFELETLMQGVKTGEELDELTALRLAAAAKHLDSTRPAFIARWEWFTPIERRVVEWSRMAKYRLADDALRRQSYDRALQFAQQVIVHDELDEPAWEIVLRALLESGDRAAAQRELRRYREITLRELHTEPSKELCDLVESPQPTPRRILRLAT